MSSGSQRADIPWPGVAARWLVHRDFGARYGSAVVLTVPPGGGYPAHRTNGVERVVYVVDAVGRLLGAGHGSPATSDDSLVLPPGVWHGFENDSNAGAVLLMLFVPSVEFPHASYEVAAADLDVSGELTRWKLHEVPGRPEITTVENGFENFSVNWDGAKGAETILLGYARFGTGGTHRWHRHRTADEGGLVLSGRGHSWHDEDVPPNVSPGDTVVTAGDRIWHPADTWHTLTMDVGDVIDNVWFYLGANTLEGTGYELREWVKHA